MEYQGMPKTMSHHFSWNKQGTTKMTHAMLDTMATAIRMLLSTWGDG